MNFWKALLYFEAPQETYWASHPGWPKFLVYAGWWLRNPFPGVTEFILGIGLTKQSSLPTFKAGGGFQFLTIQSIYTPTKTRYFASYRGKLVEWYIGWKPSGSFGIALRKANAKPETGPHVK